MLKTNPVVRAYVLSNHGRFDAHHGHASGEPKDNDGPASEFVEHYRVDPV